MSYKNQKQSVAELRAWAKSSGYVVRKGNVHLASTQAYRLYDKVSNEVVSPHFTLSDATYLNNNCDMGFYWLLYGNLTN